MLADIYKKYKWDLLVIAGLSGLTAAVTVVAHGQVKWYTGQVASIAPLVFAAAILLALTALGVLRSGRTLAVTLRVLIDLALLSLIAPTFFLEVEKTVAPYEWWQRLPVATVVERISTDDNSDRITAWARIISLPREDKDAIAAALAPMLVGTDDRAKHSAELTLAVPLRQHTLAALAALKPDLKAYLAAHAQGRTPSPEAQRAGTFASRFVSQNMGSVHKALQRDKREFLPAGGLEALCLALATEPVMGPLYLRELARHGDAVEKPIAQSVLLLAAISVPTS